jgi:hypothetical protein
MFSTSFVDGHAAFIRMRGHAYLPWTAEPSLSCAPVRGPRLAARHVAGASNTDVENRRWRIEQ